MVSVTLSHVIGTTALISLFIITGMYYSITSSSLETQIIATQLDEVANYVSSNLIDLVSLCSINNLDQLVIEELEIPERVSDHYYNVTVVKVKDPNTQEWLFMVRAYLESRPTVLGESELPLSAEGNLKVYNGTGSIIITDPTLQPEVDVSSYSTNVLAWCLKSDEKMTIGLGTRLEEA